MQSLLYRVVQLSMLSTLVSAAGCHDDIDSDQGTQVIDDTVADTVLPDTVDTTVTDTGTEDTAVTDTGPGDTTLEDTDPGDTWIEDTVGPMPGETGSPCSDESECNGSLCIEGLDGGVCSQTCSVDALCPNAWGCRQDISALPDVWFICMPPAPTFCRPCSANTDCVVNYDGSAHGCVPLGDEGAFCADDGDCPTDAFCASIQDVSGNPTRQCVSDSGACSCSPGAFGATTACAEPNSFGSCPGTRTCADDGLASCDALLPAADGCDGVDNNCDGQTDEAFLATACESTNTFGTCSGLCFCEDNMGGCDAPTPEAEVCGDGVDNDCDGLTDEEDAIGCEVYFFDADGDRYGTDASRCLCGPDGFHTTQANGDSDDGVKKVNPGAPELCNSLDDNCNVAIDEGVTDQCSNFYLDGDSDGWGDANDFQCLCGQDGAYTSTKPGDCNDGDIDVYSLAVEICNGKNDDCDLQTDEEGAGNCILHFADGDSDDYGNPSLFACLCGPTDAFPVTVAQDCDDMESAANPDETELCDGFDNNCNGAIDEQGAADCTTYFRDSDGDLFGSEIDNRCRCAPLSPYDVLQGGDCNDAVKPVKPDALETCNGVDDNCDGVTDPANADSCTVSYFDEDRDTFGIETMSQCLCQPTLSYTTTEALDCNDTNPFVNPDAAEVCNLEDDNCNDETDEGITAGCTRYYYYYYYYYDDEWGIASDSRCLCGAEGFYRAVRSGDCNDKDEAVHPFAEELCDTVDNDCDMATDEEGATNCTNYFADSDGDDYGVLSDRRCLCVPTGPHTALDGGDCDETSADVNPGAAEVCNDIDDNCDGAVDPQDSGMCVNYLRDSDGDTFGIAGDTLCLRQPGLPYTAS
ncbi:MAG: hypothetical protein ACI9MR_002681 [Myxococcota bacterium]|jgi:hypothetical protein